MFWNTPVGTALIALVVVLTLVYLWFKGYKSIVRKIVLALVIQAEKALGSGTGEFKYAMVLGHVYQYVPAIIRVFLTEAQLDQLIEWAVQYMKERLAASPLLAESFTAQLPN